MNEHIQELVRGAMADAWMQADRDGDMDKMYIPALFAENFAELIVLECAEFVSNDRQNDDYGVFLANKIKKHFGVE